MINFTSKFTSFTRSIEKDIRSGEREVLRKSGIHMKQAIRKNLNTKGTSVEGGFPKKVSGRLRKGIKYKVKGDSVTVGTASPGFHGHLLEYGTVKRVGKKGKYSGKQGARPFLAPSFNEEENTIKRLLSGNWI